MPTERGRYRFYVKEGVRGPFIAAEPVGDVLPSLQGVLCFDLENGTSMKDAMKMADLMNSIITSLTLTT
jgi:hypothetical protein